MDQKVYVISEDVRQAILSIIIKGTHPSISYEQISSVKQYMENLEPVQIMQGQNEDKLNPEKKVDITENIN